jgi:hypothetical protein
MHYLTPIALFLSLLTPFTMATPTPSTDTYIPADYYATHYAPIQLDRISTYRASHNTTLNPAQSTYLDKLTTVVKEMDTSDLPALRNEGDALFGPAECTYILTGKNSATQTRKRDIGSSFLGKRAIECDCTDEVDFCDDGFYCKYGAYGCVFNHGCGVLWLYVCNGVCTLNP